MCTHDFWLWAYISGKSLMPMLQLCNISLYVGGSKGKAGIQLKCILDTNEMYPGKLCI